MSQKLEEKEERREERARVRMRHTSPCTVDHTITCTPPQRITYNLTFIAETGGELYTGGHHLMARALDILGMAWYCV
jgi:hypothetical protein